MKRTIWLQLVDERGFPISSTTSMDLSAAGGGEEDDTGAFLQAVRAKFADSLLSDINASDLSVLGENSGVDEETARTVRVPVDDALRDAMKAANAGILAGIAASDLQVYANREVFDTEKHLQQHEKHLPLRPSTLLGGLGTSEEEALVVVVPNKRMKCCDTVVGLQTVVVGGVMLPISRKMRVNPPELVAFWQALANNNTTTKVEPGAVIALPKDVYFLENHKRGSAVYIRHCYPALLELSWKILHGEKARNLVILGSPGIGKTFFGYVILRHLARSSRVSEGSDDAPPAVVYECGPSSQRILIYRNLVIQGALRDFADVLDVPTTFYIVDAAKPVVNAAKTIVLAHHSHSNWHQFAKTSYPERSCGELLSTMWWQPEVVVFNAEVFHALFVAVCLQNSSSINTSLALLGVGFLVGCLSIYDVTRIVNKLHEIGDKIDHLRASSSSEQQHQQRLASTAILTPTFHRHQIVQRVVNIVERNAFAKQGDMAHVRAFHSFQSGISTSKIAVHDEPFKPKLSAKKIVPVGGIDGDNGRVFEMSAKKGPRSTSPDAKQSKLSLSSVVPHPISNSSNVSRSPHEIHTLQQSTVESELEPAYVKQAMKLFHVTEFLILVEYTEVIIPMVYSVYLVAMSYLPNYAYCPQLARIDHHKLAATIMNVQIYAYLELISFLLMHCTLRRKVRFSLLTQLAFVLESQWEMVQSKLILWVLYIVQLSLEHFGASRSCLFFSLAVSLVACVRLALTHILVVLL